MKTVLLTVILLGATSSFAQANIAQSGLVTGAKYSCSGKMKASETEIVNLQVDLKIDNTPQADGGNSHTVTYKIADQAREYKSCMSQYLGKGEYIVTCVKEKEAGDGDLMAISQLRFAIKNEKINELVDLSTSLVNYETRRGFTGKTDLLNVLCSRK